MALTRSLKQMYEPVVDRAIKTGGWGETKIVHDPSVVTDALFQKAQMELGIANLQADFGLKAAQIKGDLAMKSADINLRKDLALAEMQFQRDIMQTSFAEQIVAAAGGALSGYATAKNLGVSPTAGAIIGGGMAYGGAVAGRQQMQTTGSILNSMAEASQIVAQQRKEKNMSDAWSTQMQRLNDLNSKMTSRDAMSNPELAAQFHRERQMALADMYKSSVEGGMNPVQAAQWVQYMDNLTSGKTEALSTEEKTSQAFQKYMASDKGPQATKQFQMESQAAWLEARIAKGESIPGSAMDSFMKLSGEQGLPAGQIEEQFSPEQAAKKMDQQFQREMQEDRQAHAREMAGAKGSGTSKGGAKGVKLEDAFNEFLNSDMTPEDEKQFRVKAEAAMIAKNLNSGRPVDPRQIDEFVAKARGGEIIPDDKPMRDVTPVAPQRKSISANQKVAEKNQKVVPQLNKVASGQEEIQIGKPQSPKGQAMAEQQVAPHKLPPPAAKQKEEEHTYSEKRTRGQKVTDFLMNIPGPMDFMHGTAGEKAQRMVGRWSDQDQLNKEEKRHKEQLQRLEAEKNAQAKIGDRREQMAIEEKKARYGEEKIQRRNEAVAQLDRVEAKIDDLPEERLDKRNRKVGLQDQVDAIRNINNLIDRIPDDTRTRFVTYLEENGMGLSSMHFDAESIEQFTKLMGSTQAKKMFSDTERENLTEYMMELKNLSYGELLVDAGNQRPSGTEVRENLLKGGVPNIADDYLKVSKKLEILTRNILERVDGMKTKGDEMDEELEDWKRRERYKQSIKGAKRVGPGRIESPF